MIVDLIVEKPLRGTTRYRDGKKLCSKCQQFLPPEKFATNKRAWDHLNSVCRACVAVRYKKYYLEVEKPRDLANRKKAWHRHPPHQDGQKYCFTCEQWLPLEAFNKSSKRSDGLSSGCRECMVKNGRMWRAQNQERVRAVNQKYREENRERTRLMGLKSTYGLTAEDYWAMEDAQGGVCAICGLPPGQRRLHVDHDHKTGVVRALLCQHCNTGLGNFRDDVTLMQTAIGYLQVHAARAAKAGA